MRLLNLSGRLANLRTRVSNKFTLPERLKGTMLEKWARYWTGLVSDYAEVITGVTKEVRKKPRKAAIIGGLSYSLYSCAKRNPNEECFMTSLRFWSNEMVRVPSNLQNTASADYLRLLEQAVNHNKVRTFSLGVCTLLWLDLYDKDDCTYKAICKYTGVGYWNFHERLIDVGFWDKFWRLEWKMRNYDLNYL